MTSATLTPALVTALDSVVAKAAKKHGIKSRVSLVVGASGGGTRHGHFHARSWTNAEGEDVHEIMLSGESLERGAVPTLGTLLHELAHLYNFENEIKDVSDGGRYHNTRFKETAESFGVSIEKADRIGYSVTTVPEGTCNTYRKELDALGEALVAWRRPPAALAAAAQPRKTFIMVCPECDDPVPIGKGWFERNQPKCVCGNYFDLEEKWS